MKRMTRRAQRPEEIHHLGDDLDQGVSSLRPGFAYSWSGQELRRLRVTADVSSEVMAAALGISLLGLKNLESRKRLTVVAVNRYRAALSGVDIDEVITDTTSSLEGTAASRSLPSIGSRSPNGDRTNNENENHDL
jgi:hypothetical protein